MGIKEFVEDYRFISRRIDIDYDVRVHQGGFTPQVHRAWWENNVLDKGPSDSDHLRTDSAVLVILTHPFKSVGCILAYYFERTGRTLG